MTASRLIDQVANTTAHRDRDDLDVSIARLLLEFIHAKSIAIYRLLPDGENTRVARRVAVVRGEPDVGNEAVSVLSRLPLLNGNPAWEACVRERRVTEYIGANGNVRNVFPIESAQDVIGMLEVEPRRGLRPRDTVIVAGILRIVKNHLALLDYGECDTLTGLLNRKTFETSFDKLRARYAATTTVKSDASWLGIVDIDKFKTINDTYGHLFGDEVLLLVARLMQQNFRGADQLFRFGGEEFVVILDRANPVGAAIAFERLRCGIEAHKFPQVGLVTISLGYTQIDPKDAPDACVERADAALYYAKHHGRNNVRHYEALVAAGELKPAAKKSDDIELF
jgi:diguanylate cyclase (GGDEF)-like protein